VRLGILSDVHGNLPALEVSLAALRARGVDRLACAGDLVGYGPMPNECVEVVAEACAVCVAGNHDLIALGRMSADRCVPVAQRTLRWTAGVLSPAARAFLGALPLEAELDGVVLAHGALGDPQAPTRTRQVAGQLHALERDHPAARALVLGHTHEPAGWDAAGRPLTPDAGAPVPLPSPRCVLNPGAVGQTRSRALREPRVLARSIVLDTDAGTVTWLALPYPLATTRRALRHAGLPPRTYRLAAPLPRALAARAARTLRPGASPAARA
jgi:predicted phosphodiesterase